MLNYGESKVDLYKDGDASWACLNNQWMRRILNLSIKRELTL